MLPLIILFIMPVLSTFPTIDHKAKAILVKDHKTGITLLKHNIDHPLAPASLLKLAVFVTIIEMISLEDRLSTLIKIPESVKYIDKSATSIFLRPGQEVLCEDLLRGMVTASANDAAMSLATYFGSGSEERFMRESVAPRLQRIGVKQAYFNNASGLENSGTTTAEDIVTILSYIAKNHFDEYSYYFSKNPFFFEGNKYDVQSVVSAAGNGKTGFLSSDGYNFATIQNQHNGQILIAGLGWNTKQERLSSIKEIIDWSQQLFRRYNVSLQKKCFVHVKNGMRNKISLKLSDEAYIILPKHTDGTFELVCKYPSFVYGPIKIGDKIGEMTINIDNGDTLTYDLVSDEDVPQPKNLISKILTYIKNAFGY